MYVTFEGKSLPSYENTIKIIMLNEETFALKKKLKKKKIKKNWLVCKLYAGETIQQNNSQSLF